MLLYWLLMTLHVLVAICLLVVVLLQSGKGGGLSGAFGGAGATQTMFGGRGAGDFLTRSTQVLGGAFMVTSIILVLMGGTASRGGAAGENQQFIEEMREAAVRAQQGSSPLEGGGALPPLDGGTSESPPLVLPAPAEDTPAETPSEGAGTRTDDATTD